jgi:hypothetical protein
METKNDNAVQPYQVVWTGRDDKSIYSPQIEITPNGSVSISSRSRGVCLMPEQWVSIGWAYIENTLPVVPNSNLWQRLKLAWKIVVNRP